MNHRPFKELRDKLNIKLEELLRSIAVKHGVDPDLFLRQIEAGYDDPIELVAGISAYEAYKIWADACLISVKSMDDRYKYHVRLQTILEADERGIMEHYADFASYLAHLHGHDPKSIAIKGDSKGIIFDIEE